MKPLTAMAFLLAMAAPSFAMTAFLQRDLGVEGLMRYCLFSNGETYTVNSTDLCPMSVETGMFSAPSAPRMTGFKAGEYQDGMTKVCVYNVMGEQRGIRVGSVELCPLSYEF